MGKSAYVVNHLNRLGTKGNLKVQTMVSESKSKSALQNEQQHLLICPMS